MCSEIQNVPIEEASIDAILSTTGIAACFAVVIILNDDRTFIFHSDPSCINVENRGHMGYEVQKLIKETILMFKECENENNSCFKNIFVVGGLRNDKYNEFNNELNRMRKNYITVKPTLDGLNIDELQNFVKCIVYSSTIINLDGGDVDEVHGNVLISDTTILVDLTVSPPLLFLAQYYDLEKNLYGGRRKIQPHFFSIYNFNSKSWNIIKNELSDFQPAHMNEILDEFDRNSIVDDVQYTKDQLMNYLLKIKD